ncbi:hypothetical protein SCALM49S_01687 [Streptomyces californicus]
MAVFGVPVVRDDDARRALAAALGMRRALARLNEELNATLGIELATRIGINTGQVVAVRTGPPGRPWSPGRPSTSPPGWSRTRAGGRS